MNHPRFFALQTLGALLLLAIAGNGHAQECSNERPFVFSWEPIALPKPTNLCDFVKDEAAAIQLGKAFFWDMQTGSDGLTACASCHFHAGADSRSKNQLSPTGAPESQDFGASFEVASPNSDLRADQFPFHKFLDPEDRLSAVMRDSDDVVSSQGVTRGAFVDIVPGQSQEDVIVLPDPVFNVGGTNTRRVEPRNAPTIINSVFNIEQFWDGRAKFYFNGVNRHGLLDENARILVKQGDALDAPVVREKVEIDMASLASQALAPPTSAFEMSAEGRPFPKIGKKLLSLTPLGAQVVHPTDSVLGPLSRDDGTLTIPGLSTTYRAMIEAAFNEKYWQSDRLFDLEKNEVGLGLPANTDQYTLMEINFTLFWGLAIQLYESTLVSDDSPFDRFMAGDESALTEEEKRGMDLFFNPDLHCFQCHLVPELNKATIAHLVEFPTGINRIIERMRGAEGSLLEDGNVYDGGFYNVGARPLDEDLGRGGTVVIGEGADAVEQPLSFTHFALLHGEDANKIPSPKLNPPLSQDEASTVAVDGAQRVPSLRNAELTGPYYHHGAIPTLFEVVLFYTRGGDFREENINLLDRAIGTGSDEFLKGQPDNQRALARFMARPLTDDRVRFERAPFDHPEIFVPNGHIGDGASVLDDGTGRALDDMMRIPPVGASGSDTPLSTFLNLPPDAIVNLVTVPSVTGLEQSEAAAAITDALLIVGTIMEEQSDTVPMGLVISEDPPAGELRAAGSAVNLAVSSGPPPLAPTVSLSANPSSVAAGVAATLSWTSTDATECMASDGWSGPRATSGTETPPISQTTAFTLTCTGLGGSATSTATVMVLPQPTVSLSASPTSVAVGGAPTLTWTSADAAECLASEGWEGPRGTSGTETPVVSQTTTFTLTCTGPGGTAVSTATVTALPQPTVSLSANPISVAAGSTSTLTWTSTDATECMASEGWNGSRATSGTETPSVSQTTAFTLTCSGPGGTAVQTVNVSLAPPAPQVADGGATTPTDTGGSGAIDYVTLLAVMLSLLARIERGRRFRWSE